MSEVKPMVGTNPITEGMRYDSGIFDREAEAKLLAERPELAEGKKAFEKMLVEALTESNDAIDIAELMKRMPIHGILAFKGVHYIKTPTLENEVVSDYLTKLEKSLIEVHKRYADKCRVEGILRDENDRLKEQLATKRKRAKGKKK